MEKGNNKTKKRFEFKLKLDLWKIGAIILFTIFFVPFILVTLESRLDGGQVELSQALTDIRDKKVEKVEIAENKLIFSYKDGTTRVTTKEGNISFPELLERAKVPTDAVAYEVSDSTLLRVFGEVIGILLPIGVMAFVLFFLIRAQNKGAQDIFSFGRSRAKLFAKGKQSVTFDDVAGVDEAKNELEEVVDFLKNPAKYRKIGARTPKGVLLVGPSGVGKTLLAKAVAGEAGVPFFSMAGSEFMEMLVGVGASRVRDLFAQAKAQAPAIIFIDEIDAIGRQRGRGGFVGGHDEREQTLNQILVEMDGFTPNDNVMVVAATNRGDLLDPALLRPGRFDRRVTLDMPDKEGRAAILKIHAHGKRFFKNIDWARVADRTVGFSGADIENVLNEAAILAARTDKKEIEMEDIEEAATKVKMGPARKKLQSEEDRKITAYHEAGHAIVTHTLPRMDPVHRISIVARGMSLGHTLIPPAMDRSHESKSRLVEQITAMLGGRAAEEVVFNEMTAGASNDISQVTRVVRAMVTDFGMSALGPINLGPQADYGEYGRLEYMENASISPAMQERVDGEIKKLVDACYKKALEIIRKERKNLDKVAAALLAKENLDRDEFEKIVGEKKKSS